MTYEPDEILRCDIRSNDQKEDHQTDFIKVENFCLL